MTIDNIKQEIDIFLKQLCNKNQPAFITEKNSKDILILQKQLNDFELIVKDVTRLSNTSFYKISYALKDNHQEKEHTSHWFAIDKSDDNITLISRFIYLEAKAKEEKWRTIQTKNITFYFDYNIKKTLDKSDSESAVKYMLETTKIFTETAIDHLNYFVCDSKETMQALGFNHTASDKNNIISCTAFDVFEITKMFTARKNENASEFLRDGLAVFMSKFVKGGNDAFDFNSRDISPMAKEIIFNAPYANIKKCVRNNKYEDIVNTLFFFSVVYAGKNQNIDYNLIILSPPASFIKFLVKENSLIKISEKDALTAIISLLGFTEYKEIKKEFKKLFKYSLGKYNRHWKKYLKIK